MSRTAQFARVQQSVDAEMARGMVIGEAMDALLERRPLRTLAVTVAEEGFADNALLMLSQMRDRLVTRNANTAACRIDEAMERIVAVCRGEWSA